MKKICIFILCLISFGFVSNKQEIENYFEKKIMVYSFTSGFQCAEQNNGNFDKCKKEVCEIWEITEEQFDELNNI